MNDVWFVLEGRSYISRDFLTRAMSKALKISDATQSKATCVVMGRVKGDEFYRYILDLGFNSIIEVNDVLDGNYSPNLYIHALNQLISSNHPSLIVFPSTTHFEDIAAQIAAVIGASCSWVTDINVSGDDLLLQSRAKNGEDEIILKSSFGDSLIIAVIKNTAKFSPVLKKHNSGKIHQQSVDFSDCVVITKCLGLEKENIENIDLEDAEIVIGGGRGVDSPKAWGLIDDLSRCLHAKVGGSRASVSAGFIDRNLQIGASGKKISPKFYIAVGISGSPPHHDGIKNAECVICINNDITAPLVSYANLSIIADLYEFLPMLIDHMQNIKSVE